MSPHRAVYNGRPVTESANRQAEIDRIDWYHELDFGNGLRSRPQSPDMAGFRSTWQFIERQLDGVDFRDKSVLDVGCWDGRWSFYAERHGARDVLATDDVSQNWSTGEGLTLARQILQSQIEVNQDLSIYQLGSLGRTFDIVMCLGIYYHLHDPFYAFSQIRHCCHPGSLVLLEGEVGLTLPSSHVVYTFDRPSVLKFLPSVGSLEDLLQAAYLQVSSHVWGGPHGPLRTMLASLRHGMSARRRVFTVCTPFDGANPHHPYPPPFGLDAYDERFRSPS